MIKEAIDSSSLMVMQTEFSVYVLLRLWLYLQLHPDWDGRGQDAIIVSHRYFQVRFQLYPLRLVTSQAISFYTGKGESHRDLLFRQSRRSRLC